MKSPTDETWITRDGRSLKVSEMDEEHVRAAFNMILARARRRQQRESLRRQLVSQMMSLDSDDDIHWGDS